MIESFLSQQNSVSVLLTGVSQQWNSKSSIIGEKMKEQLYFKIQQAEIFYKVSAVFKF